jgi:hypothetical protein
VCPLATNRKATAMSQTAVTPKVHEALDIETNFPAQVAFNLDLQFFDDFADSATFVVVEIVAAFIRGNLYRIQNYFGLVFTDSIDVSERNFHALISGKVDACNTSHDRSSRLTLPLVMAAVITNNPNDSSSPNHLTLLTNLLNGCSNFHE